MNTRTLELLVGLFVAAGFAALFMLAMSASNLASFGGEDGYVIKARFDNIGGLKVRSPVAASGVRIGRVSDISYDLEGLEAVVSMSIDPQYNVFPIDSSASILTSGLLGEQYIGLQPGADDDYLLDGNEITITQSAIILERVISQFLFSKAAE